MDLFTHILKHKIKSALFKPVTVIKLQLDVSEGLNGRCHSSTQQLCRSQSQ